MKVKYQTEDPELKSQIENLDKEWEVEKRALEEDIEDLEDEINAMN